MASWILLQSWTAFPLCFINRPIKVGTKVIVVPTMNFKSSQLGSNISLLIKIGTITTNTVVPTRNKIAYSCSIKIHFFGISEILESITTNKAGRSDGIPVELFQILKDDAVKVLHSICQQIWRTQQWPPKERQCQRMLKLPHNCTHLTH